MTKKFGLLSSPARRNGLCLILWFMGGGGVDVQPSNNFASVTSTVTLSTSTPLDNSSILSSEPSYLEQDLAGFRHMDLSNENMIPLNEIPVTDEITLFTEELASGAANHPGGDPRALDSQPTTSVQSDVAGSQTVTVPTSTVSTSVVTYSAVTQTTSAVTGAITSMGIVSSADSRPLKAPPGLEKKSLVTGSQSVRPKIKDVKAKKKKVEKVGFPKTHTFLKQVKASALLGAKVGNPIQASGSGV